MSKEVPGGTSQNGIDLNNFVMPDASVMPVVMLERKEYDRLTRERDQLRAELAKAHRLNNQLSILTASARATLTAWHRSDTGYNLEVAEAMAALGVCLEHEGES
jgi:hypothetical protein